MMATDKRKNKPTPRKEAETPAAVVGLPSNEAPGSVPIDPPVVESVAAVEVQPEVTEPEVTEQPPAAKKAPPAKQDDEIQYVTIKVPIRVRAAAGFMARDINVKNMTGRQRIALKQLKEGLDVAGVTLNNGKQVRDWGDGVRLLLEQIADAVEG